MNAVPYAVSVKNLCKSYPNAIALDNVSFDVKKSELFGIIGPDGAGKTSLFRILTTLLLPDSGSATLQGLDCVNDYKKIRKIIGYMPGKFSLYQDLSVEENLKFFATIFGTTIEENYDLIKDIYIQIEPFKTRPAGKLSGGMKQKLALCCAMIHKPEVLILDEPTTGVDAVSRKEFWEMLKRLNKAGITILVSTPYMDEAILCDRVALIQDGKILSTDTPQHIINTFGKILYSVKTNNIHKLMNDLNSWEHTNCAYLFGQQIHLTLINENFNDKDIQQYLSHKGNTDIKVEQIKAGIEDTFMSLMTKQHHE